MYLAIDIGGSKTLVAVFSLSGEVVFKHKLATNTSYQGFLNDLKKIINEQLKDYQLLYGCCAVPGRLDRDRGIARNLGNLDWENVPIKQDISVLIGGTPIVIENDGNLGALSEAILVHKKYKKVFYLTVGTGIGDGTIIDGKIEMSLADGEPGQMVLEHEGDLIKWEHLASGSALVKRFGKKASELEDAAIWQIYSHDLARGIEPLIALVQPEVVIIGGGIGAHFDKFKQALHSELKKLENDMVKIPPIIAAQRPEEAVIYGCYELIKQQR